MKAEIHVTCKMFQ